MSAAVPPAPASGADGCAVDVGPPVRGEEASAAARGRRLADGARMPDLVRPRRGAHHTLDTALRALRALGVDGARLTLESAGAGWAPDAIVRQHPPPGAPLDATTHVTLAVAGLGAVEALPYALRDVDGSPFGVDPLLALLDDPVHRLRHHLRAGGDFFALRPGDPVAARRWIEQVFQLDPTRWDAARWPAVARLLPTLHRLAGRTAGIALALDVVFGLPLAGVVTHRRLVRAAERGRLALGTAAARLGVDTLLGAGRREVARLELAIGPVPLATYRAHQAPALAAERRALYALLLPLALADAVEERWTVGDPHEPARLAGGAASGDAAGGADATGADATGAAAVLGLTARLGR